MEKVLKATLQTCGITKKDLLILSVSGGVDSMSMLDFFVRQNYQIEVVHFNHLQRAQSAEEAALVEHYCQTYAIPYHYYTINVDQGNFHHQAHILRHQYLHDVAKITKASYILTAHHLDDLLESILIKLTRGSNLLGYAGMQPCHIDKYITFVKPLLYVSKERLIAYAKKHDVQYMNDASNDGNAYLRNRYRHAIVPIMKQENDDLLTQTKQFHHQVSTAFKFIRKTSIDYLKKRKQIHIPSYKTLDVAIQEDVIAYMLESLHMNVTYEKIITIKEMLLKNAPNKTYKIDKKHYFVKHYDYADIQVLKPLSNDLIEVKDGVNTLPNMAIFTFLGNSSVKTEDLQKLCYNKLAFPLWLRNRKDGDLLAYTYGHKKLKKLLIDEKVPMLSRNQLWILQDNDGQILWVEDHYINETLGNENILYFTLKENDHAS